MTPQSSFPLALQWNSVDGAVRGVWLCFGTGGNIQCRRGSPFPHGRKAHVSTAGPLAPREAALRSAPLRETLLPRHPDDARSALAIPAPRAPSCRSIMRGRRRSKPAMPRLRRPRLSSTQFCSRAFPPPLLAFRPFTRYKPERTSFSHQADLVCARPLSCPTPFGVDASTEVQHRKVPHVASYLRRRSSCLRGLLDPAGGRAPGTDSPWRGYAVPRPRPVARPGRDGTAALHACTVLFPHAKRTIPRFNPSMTGICAAPHGTA